MAWDVADGAAVIDDDAGGGEVAEEEAFDEGGDMADSAGGGGEGGCGEVLTEGRFGGYFGEGVSGGGVFLAAEDFPAGVDGLDSPASKNITASVSPALMVSAPV